MSFKKTLLLALLFPIVALGATIEEVFLESFPNVNIIHVKIAGMQENEKQTLVFDPINNEQIKKINFTDKTGEYVSVDFSGISKDKARNYLLGDIYLEESGGVTADSCSISKEVCTQSITDISAYSAKITGSVKDSNNLEKVGYSCNGKTVLIDPPTSGKVFQIDIDDLYPKQNYECSFAAVIDDKNTKGSTLEFTTLKPRVILREIKNLGNQKAEFAIELNNFGKIKTYAQIWYKKALTDKWIEVPRPIPSSSMEEAKYWIKTYDIIPNEEYIATPIITSDKNENIYIDRFSEEIDGKIVDHKDPIKFTLETKPFVRTLDPIVDKNIVTLRAGSIGYGLDFDAWFRIAEPREDGKWNIFTTLPVKKGKDAESFAQTLNLEETELVADNKKVNFSFTPNTTYKVRAMARNENGTVEASEAVDLTTGIIPARVTTLKNGVATSKKVVLNGRLEYVGAKTADVGFIVWEKGQTAEKKYTAGTIDREKEYSLSVDITGGKNYCYAAFAQNEMQKSSGTNSKSTEICFEAPKESYLNVPFYSQGGGPWAWESWDNWCGGEYPSFASSGCGETSLSMIITYWYDKDPTVKKLWDKKLQEVKNIERDPLRYPYRLYPYKNIDKYGSKPNPFSVNRFVIAKGAFGGSDGCHWNENMGAVLNEIGLQIEWVNTNDIKRNEYYIDRGIPLLVRCKPSYITGSSVGHFIVVTGFYSDKQYRYGSRYYLNNMFINDPAVRNATGGKNTKLKIEERLPSACGYQYGRIDGERLEKEKLDGTTAIFPTGYMNNL